MATPRVQALRHRYRVVGVDGQPVEVSGDVIEYFDTDITFTDSNGLQTFTVPMPGSFEGSPIVVATPIDVSSVPGEIVGIQGAYHDGLGNCIVYAYYPGVAPSVTQPIRIMWVI